MGSGHRNNDTWYDERRKPSGMACAPRAVMVENGTLDTGGLMPAMSGHPTPSQILAGRVVENEPDVDEGATGYLMRASL